MVRGERAEQPLGAAHMCLNQAGHSSCTRALHRFETHAAAHAAGPLALAQGSEDFKGSKEEWERQKYDAIKAYVEWVPIRGMQHDKIDLQGCNRSFKFGDLATIVSGAFYLLLTLSGCFTCCCLPAAACCPKALPALLATSPTDGQTPCDAACRVLCPRCLVLILPPSLPGACCLSLPADVGGGAAVCALRARRYEGDSFLQGDSWKGYEGGGWVWEALHHGTLRDICFACKVLHG